MGDRIFLMFPKLNFGIHTTENDMASVILTGTDTVELVVIQPYQLFPSCGITPYPILKALLDKLLLRLGDSGFLFIEYSFLFALIIFHIVKDTHIFHIERIFDNLVGVYPLCAVGVVGFQVSTVIGFSLHIPFARQL